MALWFSRIACLKRFERLVNRMLLQKDFSRGRPNHHHARAAVLLLPLGDLIDQLLRQLKLVLAGLYVRSAQPLHIILIKDRLHRLDLLKRRLQLFQQIFFEHAGMHGRFVGRVRKNVPGAKDQIFKFRQRHEVLD